MRVLGVWLAAILAGCSGDPPRDGLRLDKALARTYHGRPLRELLLASQESPRASLEVPLGFRALFREDGGRLLAEAVMAGIPADGRTALGLLHSDLEAASHARGLLEDWVDREEMARDRLTVARLLLETGAESPRAVEVLRRTLHRKDPSAMEPAIMQLLCLGKRVDLFAEDLVGILETYPPDPRSRSRIDYGPARAEGPSYWTGEMLELFAAAGAGADPYVGRIAALLEQPDYCWKDAALDALASRGAAGAPHVAAILLCADDEDEGVRAAVARALARIGVMTDEVAATLRHLTQDADEQVREAAALAQEGHSERSQPEPELPEGLDRALDQRYRGRTLRELLLGIAPEHPRFVEEARIGFRVVHGDEGPRLLAAAVAAGLPANRNDAVFLLDRDLDAAEHARELLEAWLASEEDAGQRLWIARLLLGTGVPGHADVLRNALRNGDSEAFDAATAQIGMLGARADLFAADLLDGLESRPMEDWKERCLLELLTRAGRGADPLVPRIAALLDSPVHDWVAVLDALAARGAAAACALDTVLAHAGDPDARVRAAVARALGRMEIRPERLSAALDRLAQDPDEGVRAAARSGAETPAGE